MLAAVAGWYFARDAIHPVVEINHQFNNISAGNLHDRLTVGREKDELAQLAQTFNLMLDRLELAFKAQKSFVSHANLMENGCKYPEQQKVKVRLDTSEAAVILRFTDEGVGIPANDIPFLFDTFYRSEDAMNRKGYGIGLALTKRIIDIHKGSILVESTPGTGSSFVVSFSKNQVTEI